ncbi:hypothetical protein BBG47_27855 [Paenibacillus sp. KS1]|uniref:hypothetical protein n=1 Tax=Paenibacillus sp. KS1 TaxID=1849249 RepID=UPI0008066195|nr:hypothetical protein [Paenibacillus sp. KS1]OBY76322.1 hypothetical protein BBG47_27855 [Paenibacillus sp. KS1]
MNMSAEIKQQLIEKTVNGLFIDFKKITKNRNEIRIPLLEVGQFTNMDKVYDLRKEKRSYNTWLIFSEEKCELVKDG